MTQAVMIQGAGSNVGKSLIVAGLCRSFAKRGLKVRPFKPQNMSNNAAVTTEGGEIGRAQALQASAAYCAPSIHMNPVLLKPESEAGAQIIVQGSRYKTMKAAEYGQHKAQLLPKVLESFRIMQDQADIVIIEGAGSPAEINLRGGDIANMGFAEAADVPVIITGDIDRGGVIASLVGTAHILPQDDASRIKGFIINKFRGDPRLFDEGSKSIEQFTHWPSLGLIPWFEAAKMLPAEDGLDLSNKTTKGRGGYHLVVPKIPRIANFDDIDPFMAEENVRITLVEGGAPLPRDADMVLLPGSKSTLADLDYFRQQGWDIDLFALARQGVSIIGLCGGYQMLGKTIHDPLGIEGKKTKAFGLGLLDIETTLGAHKTVGTAEGVEASTNQKVKGYEIHLGKTSGKDCQRPMIKMNDGRLDGAVSASQNVRGCYMHGLFAEDTFRKAFLQQDSNLEFGQVNFNESLDRHLNDLAAHLETHLDLDKIAAIAGL